MILAAAPPTWLIALLVAGVPFSLVTTILAVWKARGDSRNAATTAANTAVAAASVAWAALVDEQGKRITMLHEHINACEARSDEQEKRIADLEYALAVKTIHEKPRGGKRGPRDPRRARGDA